MVPVIFHKFFQKELTEQVSIRENRLRNAMIANYICIEHVDELSSISHHSAANKVSHLSKSINSNKDSIPTMYEANSSQNPYKYLSKDRQE